MYQSKGMNTSTGARNTPAPSSFRANTSSFGMRKSFSPTSQAQSTPRPYGEYTDLFNAARDYNQQNLQQARQLNLEQDTRYFNMGRSAYDYTSSTDARYDNQKSNINHGHNMDYQRQDQVGTVANNAMLYQDNAAERQAKYADSAADRLALERKAALEAASSERIAGIQAGANANAARIQAQSGLLQSFLGQPANFRYW